jgi:hypothetical protein
MSRDWTEFGRGTPPKVLRYNRVDHEELIVEPPLADSLSHGRVVIQYRTENLHIAPVFRPGALAVSPRVGHLHVSVDDLPCHWVDASGEPLTVVGLPAGPHKIRINLANANHTVLETQTVNFVIPSWKRPATASSDWNPRSANSSVVPSRSGTCSHLFSARIFEKYQNTPGYSGQLVIRCAEQFEINGHVLAIDRNYDVGRVLCAYPFPLLWNAEICLYHTSPLLTNSSDPRD